MVKDVKAFGVYLGALTTLVVALTVLQDKLRVFAGPNEWLFWCLVLFPVPIALVQLVFQLRQVARKRRLQLQAEHRELRDPEYFRTYPYDSIPDYLKGFRADKAHEKVLDWIRRAQDPLLFLTGRSGTGKTSILEAYIRPQLESQDPPVKNLLVRGFGDPLESMAKGLAGLLPPEYREPGEDIPDPREELERTAHALAPQRLLIIFDQFEEILIIHEREPERIERIREFLASIVAEPIRGVTVLLSLRSDYVPLLERLDLPPLCDRDNWMDVGPFTKTHARQFLNGSKLPFTDQSVEHVFDQIAAFERTPGLIRPIILNMVGLIASKSDHFLQASRSRMSQSLLVEYFRQCVFRRDMSEHAPKILSKMVTKAGSKKPRLAPEVASETRIPRSEVLGCLNFLGKDGIVRCIDTKTQLWEVAHDFIAYYLLLVLDRTRRSLWQLIRPWLPLTALASWIAIAAVLTVLYPQYRNQKIIAAIESVKRNAITYDTDLGGWSVDLSSVDDRAALRRLLSIVHRLTPLKSLRLNESGIAGDDLRNLQELTWLEELNLGYNVIDDDSLAHLPDLPSLRKLYLMWTPISGDGLAHLAELTTLEELELAANDIDDVGLAHLSALTSLKILRLRTNNITGSGLGNLETLAKLEELDLTENKIDNAGLADILRVPSLKRLYLIGNVNITDAGLAHLQGLKNLEYLNLVYTSVTPQGCDELRQGNTKLRIRY